MLGFTVAQSTAISSIQPHRATNMTVDSNEYLVCKLLQKWSHDVLFYLMSMVSYMFIFIYVTNWLTIYKEIRDKYRHPDVDKVTRNWSRIVWLVSPTHNNWTVKICSVANELFILSTIRDVVVSFGTGTFNLCSVYLYTFHIFFLMLEKHILTFLFRLWKKIRCVCFIFSVGICFHASVYTWMFTTQCTV